MSKKKKIICIVLASLAGAAILAGIGLAIRHSVRGSRVIVISAEEQAEYEGPDEDSSDIEGLITSGASQSIYLTEAMPVKEVKVKEGQHVQKGDVLLIYDTTKTTFAVEKQALQIKQIENALQITERNIRTLQNIKPSSGDDYSDDADDTDETPKKKKKTTPKKKTEPKKEEPKKEDPKEDPYKDVKGVDKLTGADVKKAYNNNSSEKDLGTQNNPYRFLCKETATIEASFIREMKKWATEKKAPLFFAIEVRAEDKGSGDLRMMWMNDANYLPAVGEEDNWEWTLQFAKKTQEADEGDNTADPEGTSYGDTGSSPKVVLLAGIMGDEDMDEGDDDDYDTSNSLISASESYTSDELREALIEEKEKLADLQLDLREAKLKLKKAKKALSKGTAKASANGVVKTVGDPTNPPKDGSAFLTVGSVKGLTVQGAISERKLGRIKSGDKIRINSWQTGEQLTATVDDISPYPDTTGMFSSVDSTASMYPFTANLDETDTELSEGEWVEVLLGSGSFEEDADQSLYVMKAFIRNDGDQKYVLKRSKGGRLKKQVIEVGKSSGSSYEVISGLKADDWIAFPYGKNAKEGAKTREGTLDELYEM